MLCRVIKNEFWWNASGGSSKGPHPGGFPLFTWMGYYQGVPHAGPSLSIRLGGYGVSGGMGDLSALISCLLGRTLQCLNLKFVPKHTN